MHQVAEQQCRKQSRRFVALLLLLFLSFVLITNFFYTREELRDTHASLLSLTAGYTHLILHLVDAHADASVDQAHPASVAHFAETMPLLPLGRHAAWVTLVWRTPEGLQHAPHVEYPKSLPLLDAFDRWFYQADPAPGAAASRALAGQEGVMTGLDLHGNPILAAYAPIPGTPWGLVAQAQLSRLRNSMLMSLGLALGTALLFAGIAWALMRRLILPMLRRLEHSEALQQTIIEGGEQGVLLLDDLLRITQANGEAARMFGRTPTELQQRPLTDLLTVAHGGLSADQLRRYAQEASTGNIVAFMVALPAASGGVLLAEALLKPLTSSSPGRQLLILRDVTDAEQAQRQLASSQNRLSTIFEASMDGLLVIDVESGRLLDANGRAREMVEVLADDQLDGRGCPQLLQIVREWHADPRSAMTFLERELEFEVRHGRKFWVDLGLRRISYDGRDAMLVRLVDASDRRAQQQALTQLSEQLQFVLRETSVGTFSYDRATGLTHWDATCFQIYGLVPRDEPLTYDQILECVHPDDRATLLRRHEQFLGSRSGDVFEYRVVWPDLSVHHLIARARQRFENGEPTHIVGVTMDISEMRHLQDATINLATALEQVQEAVMILDATGRVVYLNQAFEQISGRRAEDVIGRLPLAMMNDRTVPRRPRAIAEAMRRGDVWRGRLRHRLQNGQILDVDVTASPVHRDQDALSSIVVVVRDISNMLALERQFFQAQKMEAIGRLAGGMAHDFNNLLTVILGYSEIIAHSSDDAFLQESVREVICASERAVALTRQLLIFARRQAIEPRVIDVNELIRNLNKMLRRLIGEDIEMHTELQPDLWTIRIDPGQFEQVLMNLTVNARDAMPEGGRLLIRTDNVQQVDGADAEVPVGDYARLTIEDEGCGMPPELIGQIFDPFFTTKEQGKGTGLGLATVYGTVRQAGGHIRVQSAPGKGTSFQLLFPVCHEGRPGMLVDERQTQPPGGSETILLAEDDPQVRAMTAEILAKLGYRTLIAADGVEAMDLLMHADEPIDLLLSDVVMPRMNGRQLAAECARLRPHTAILFVSGYAENAITHQGVVEEGLQFLPKPFTPAGLARKIRSVLDARGALNLGTIKE